ncbi:Acg family FMN-binding oxidoreductase [Thermaurantiacus tibetensis]|uniref:Acg family FMN-binding oxidoreductase n=1 Tax=Thermaurantiacus tibetensis TaxID=2759035 RepID=UPI0018907B12|nr:twin-arginine translocation pathway signal protein [Thermaurantiacus tibetensis]
MAVSRRTVILAGAGGLALVGAGAWWRVSRVPETATAPWDLAGPPPADVRLDAFRHAILAPSAHNLQPWRIRLDGEDSATLYCDLDQRLPEADPFDRQLTIGFGCFLELARMAAAARGVAMEIVPFPEGTPPGGREGGLDARPVAQLTFAPRAGLPPDPLFAHVAARRSNKAAYDLSRPVDRRELRQLTANGLDWRVRGTTTPRFVEPIRDLVLEALAIELGTPRVHRETVGLMRIGAREVDASPDGIALTGPAVEAAAAVGLMTREALAEPGSAMFETGARQLRASHAATPAFLWVVTDRNDRESQLRAGRVYVRANLAATSLGLAMHPVSQALQEYPEVADVHARLHALLVPEGGHVQMLARVGYGPEVPPSPRHPLEAKLV